MSEKNYVQGFDLQQYLTAGVENIIKSALRATLKDPRESAFLLRYAKASKAASEKRAIAEKEGLHIPPFLIASITSSCNLHCAGCYARHNHACHDGAATGQLSDEEWLTIFKEAVSLGIGFILLAGGEPMIRRDVIRAASRVPEILFPVFTNGTLLDDEYLQLFDLHRHIIPVFSIEGREEKTDERRGDGVYRKLISSMDRMKENHLLFGASVTVTRSNIHEVVSPQFLTNLQNRGCKVVFYVEYVPVSAESKDLAPGDEEREFLTKTLRKLRESYPEMLFISFPGDEKSSGGCLAAGRGFFHINAVGGAEPCPFSPYSDISVRDTSLKEALQSPLFRALQEENLLSGEHSGGCVLFEQKDRVEALVTQTKDKGRGTV